MKTVELLNSKTSPRNKGAYRYNELSVMAKINYKALISINSCQVSIMAVVKGSPVFAFGLLG